MESCVVFVRVYLAFIGRGAFCSVITVDDDDDDCRRTNMQKAVVSRQTVYVVFTYSVPQNSGQKKVPSCSIPLRW